MVPSIPLKNKTTQAAAWMLLLTLVCSLPLSAQADKRKKPSAAQLKESKQHYQNARDHHEHEEYLAAAQEYEAAYAAYANPEFIFNAAQVYRLAGKLQTALEYYDKYLELDPDGRGAADARANRAILEEEIAAEQAKEAEAKRLEDERIALEAKRAAELEAKQAAEQEASAESTPTTPPPAVQHGGNKGLRIAGMATAGVGVLALGLGIKFGLDAKGLESDVEGNTVWNQADFDDGKDAERNAFIFYGVSAVALGAGTVMYVLGRDSTRQAREQGALRIVPMGNAQSAGLLVQGGF